MLMTQHIPLGTAAAAVAAATTTITGTGAAISVKLDRDSKLQHYSWAVRKMRNFANALLQRDKYHHPQLGSRVSQQRQRIQFDCLRAIMRGVQQRLGAAAAPKVPLFRVEQHQPRLLWKVGRRF